MRLLFILTILLCSACSGSKKTNASTFEPNATDQISLKRTGCFGTCPIYEVVIFGNGIVTYEGKAHTDFEGKHVGQMDANQVKELFVKASSLDWETYPNEYPIDNVDFPQFFLRFNTGETDKLIKGNTKAAEELIRLSKEIDDLMKEVNLKKQ